MDLKEPMAGLARLASGVEDSKVHEMSVMN